MRLNLATKLEQQQVLAPQMILSMDILLLNSLDLESRLEREFMENPALEVEESLGSTTEEPRQDERDQEIKELLDVLDAFEQRYGGEEPPRRARTDARESKHEALLNAASRSDSLADALSEQIGYLELEAPLGRACRQIANNLSQRGYLLGTLQELAGSLSLDPELAEQALAVVQSLDPRGVGARDLKECLLLQLGPDDCLERRIIENHLDDLLDNRLPRIAESLHAELDEVKEAVETISLLDPNPGSAFAVDEGNLVVPELFVDEIEGRFRVRMDERHLPALRVSPACSALLKENGQNPRVLDFVRRKVEAARWLIHAVEQRRRTLLDIAQAIVDHQSEFFLRGPGHIAALTMQTIADRVGVHISTVSRATNGKYIETPFGVMELRRFFTGGVEKADGGIESRDNVCELIKSIVGAEDARRPFSDSQLARKLHQQGIEIARRTVTKYRERAGVPAARLRKKY